MESCFNFQYVVEFKVPHRLGLRFYLNISLKLFCSPSHAQFKVIRQNLDNFVRESLLPLDPCALPLPPPFVRSRGEGEILERDL